MREIGTIADEDHALTFVDYLLTRKITTHLEEQPDGWVVWVRDEDQVPAAKQELQQFQQHPDDPRYVGASSAAEQLRKEEEARERQYRKNLIEVRARWSGFAVRPGPLTLIFIAVSILVGLWTGFGEGDGRILNLLSFSSFVTNENGKIISDNGLDNILHGEVWRLVTPIFIHIGPFHLVFNVLALHVLGNQFEARRGTWRMAVFCVVTGILSNSAQFFVSGPGFGGMSGVLFGLFGYIWMKSKFDPASGMYIHPQNIAFMIGWFFLCMTGWVGDIGNAAHTVGLAVGLAVGAAPVLWKKLTR